MLRLVPQPPVVPLRSLEFNDLVPLTAALSETDAELAWQAGLEALRSLGFTAPAESGGTLLELASGQHLASLRLVPHLTDEAIAVLKNLFQAALTRLEDQRKLRQSTERMEMLSAASFEGIMVHENGLVTDANARLAELLRAKPEDVLGDWPFKHCIAAEDRPDVMKRMIEGYEGAYVITGVRKDGSRFRAELQSKQGKLGERPVRVAAVRDVTEREQTMALLRESERRLRELAEVVFDVTVLSQDGVIVDVVGNPQQLYGCSAEQVIGQPMLNFVALSSAPLVTQIVAEGKSCRYEATARNVRGELVPVEVVGISSTVEGKPTRVSGLRDLRAPQRVEAERRQLEKQLERSQRMDSLGVLAGGIAHDFNNLLVGILGNADLLLLDAHDDQTRETLEAIVGASQQAAALTARLLAYAGRGESMQRTPVEIGALLKELRTLLAAKLSKRAEVAIELAGEATVLADRSALTQVFMNLLTNASDALGEEAGRIAVSVKSVQRPDPDWDEAVGANVGPGNWILVEVQDSGVGMDEATLERIFEPFFTTKPGGHGLGLAACLGIVAAHGGAIRVESKVGAGSRFSLLLPSTTPQPLTPVTPSNVHAAAPCRVLIIDDEAIVRAQMRRSLELRGYVVTEADSGAAGISAYQACKVDLIVLDMTMPDLDGADVVAQLRALGATVPILLASGYFDAATEQRLQPASFQGFLRKPFGIRELLRAVELARQNAVST